MPDRPNWEPAEVAFADALAALPLAAPAPSAWPTLEASIARRIAQRRRRNQWRTGLAAAAVLLAGVPLLRLWSPTPVDAPPPDVVAATASPRSDLTERNQVLQAQLVAFGEPLDAGAALAAAELEDLIGMVDVQLSAAEHSDQSELLWRQRLALMQELASIHAQGDYRLAHNDSSRAGVTPASYVVD